MIRNKTFSDFTQEAFQALPQELCPHSRALKPGRPLGYCLLLYIALAFR
jgi:hypothetical protein